MGGGGGQPLKLYSRPALTFSPETMICLSQSRSRRSDSTSFSSAAVRAWSSPARWRKEYVSRRRPRGHRAYRPGRTGRLLEGGLALLLLGTEAGRSLGVAPTLVLLGREGRGRLVATDAERRESTGQRDAPPRKQCRGWTHSSSNEPGEGRAEAETESLRFMPAEAPPAGATSTAAPG